MGTFWLEWLKQSSRCKRLLVYSWRIKRSILWILLACFTITPTPSVLLEHIDRGVCVVSSELTSSNTSLDVSLSVDYF